MAVHVFGSAKGSPGVTTTVLALAARWPDQREPFVFEADPDFFPVICPQCGSEDTMRT